MKAHNPITWQGMADLVKHVGAVLAAAGIIAAGWVSLGLPVPVSQASVDTLKIDLVQQDNEHEAFMRDTRRLLLLMQKNTALSQLAEFREREELGERSSDIRKMKLSLEREIANVDRQLSRLGVEPTR